jgi:periplasmic protein TonB
MRDIGVGKTDAELASSEMTLGRCLVEGDPVAASRARRIHRRAFGASLAIELLLLGLLVAVPFLTSVARPKLQPILPPQLTFLRDRRERNLAHRVVPPTTAHHAEIPNPFPQPALTATILPDLRSVESSVPIPDLLGEDAPGSGQAIEIGRIPPPVEPRHITQPAQQEERPVKISEGVLEAQLISRIEPQYPAFALQTKTEGTVRLHAIINREGRITSLDVLSGHPFLVKAALDAVRQWRYRPTLLNGEPVEVETSITVIFRLHE